ncbi:hypothetical protein [Herbaspirillum robiniae]|uniref:hypothetical protein n=1 Tax=Herbaspirillum robiniae TaxID=2014887 RepID=UPI003D775517
MSFFANAVLMEVSEVNKENQIAYFVDLVATWVCEGYSANIRYIASGLANDHYLWNATINLVPLSEHRDQDVHISGDGFSAGKVHKNGEAKEAILQLVSQAVSGKFKLSGRSLSVWTSSELDYFSEMYRRNSWYSKGHIQIIGNQRSSITALELLEIDSTLRRGSPPFDGVDDLFGWLGLGGFGLKETPPAINIFVEPPVVLVIPKCNLVDNRLTLTLAAQENVDIALIGLAIRAAPGDDLNTRVQVAAAVNWMQPNNGIREGTLEIQLANAESALAILSVGRFVAQRHWIGDKEKARNSRFLSLQFFDKELKMLKRALLEASDSAKFENGIAALLFMLGFSAAVQLETDAPDLIVTTPNGRIVLIECTLRTADVSLKVGKLVTGAGLLQRRLVLAGIPTIFPVFWSADFPETKYQFLLMISLELKSAC